MMTDRLDDILMQALAPDEKPAEALNQKILRQIKEEEMMKNEYGRDNLWTGGRRRFPAAVLAAALVLALGSVSALAAVKLLKPAEVAEIMRDETLTAAFSSEAAISAETQSFGGYDVAFMGIVSGDGIYRYCGAGEDLYDDRSYIVVAITHSDGTPMPEISAEAYGAEDFFVSPLIQGCDPAWYNAAAFAGGYREISVNGVYYRIVECDNVEPFADRELYLGVTDGAMYNSEAFEYDEESGRIARNEGYQGLNALFRLPIDPTKADADAANAYLARLRGELSASAADGGVAEAAALDADMKEMLGEDYQAWRDAMDWFSALTPENIGEYAVPVESTRRILTPDADGYIGGWVWEVEGRGGGNGGRYRVDEIFEHADEDNQTVLGTLMTTGALDSAVVTTFTLNADGTVTFVAYVPKEG